jgi:hypothetical protein
MKINVQILNKTLNAAFLIETNRILPFLIIKIIDDELGQESLLLQGQAG